MYKEKDFSNLIGIKGFSDNLLNNHFKLYQGYVSNTNKIIELLKNLELGSLEYAELKRRFGWEFNGMRLHELYFENLTKEFRLLDKNSDIYKKLSNCFGSYEEWEKDFKSVGSLRGIGWVILYYDKKSEKLFNIWINEHDTGHLSGCVPLLVMDVFEHAFMIDYGLNKKDYIKTFFDSINWNAVEKRLK